MVVPTKSQNDEIWLFVYGTLREKCDNPQARRLKLETRERYSARVPGLLYRINWYPGLVAAPATGAYVYGDLVRLASADSWEWIDLYEGCRQSDPAPHEYSRRTVRCEYGHNWRESAEAQTYIYQAGNKGLDAIPSGDWLCP